MKSFQQMNENFNFLKSDDASRQFLSGYDGPTTEE